jgi:hypothetical protein
VFQNTGNGLHAFGDSLKRVAPQECLQLECLLASFVFFHAAPVSAAAVEDATPMILISAEDTTVNKLQQTTAINWWMATMVGVS